MNTVPMITPGSITGIEGLGTRPVYFVKLHGAATANLVIKGEADAQTMSSKELEISISWASKLMKNVQNSQVNSKLMNPAEIQVFKTAAAAKFGKDTREFDFVFGDFRCKWVKMPFVNGLSDADFLSEVEAKSGDYTYKTREFDMRLFKMTIIKLSEDAVWRDLGKTVAVDIFNGNNDRFNLVTGQWSNFGNIMFLTGGQTRVIGLDTFDTNSSGTTANLSRRGGVFPELRILIDAAKRRQFATACTKSVGETLRFRAVEDGRVHTIKLQVNGQTGQGTMELSCSILPKLFIPFAEPFEQGLAQGANDLRTYLQAKVAQYGAAPAGAPAFAAAAAPHRFAGGHRAPARPAALTPGVRPATLAPTKTMPQGILDRMKFLGW